MQVLAQEGAVAPPCTLCEVLPFAIVEGAFRKDRGDIAQLGEHLHGMQGVGGSSPPISTTPLSDLFYSNLQSRIVIYAQPTTFQRRDGCTSQSPGMMEKQLQPSLAQSLEKVG